MLYYIYVLVGGVVVYVFISFIFFLLQEKMIFWPTQLADDYQFNFDAPFEEITLEYRNNVKINCLHFKVKDPKGCILYHHGNADDLRRWGKKHYLFTKQGYDVFFYDYRGFGKSKGRRSEFGLFRDARRIHNYLKIHYPEDRIVQYGISLGSGIAAKLASKIKAPLLILETPYLSMLSMAKRKAPFLWNRLVLRFHIRTDHFVKKIAGCIYIFHGTRDELIPYVHGKSLSLISNHARMITINGAKHNNLEEFDKYQVELAEILKKFKE